jgi:scyllo-inositol 2-dehydrogenase (NAD+)
VSTVRRKLGIGLVAVGRLGRVYARDLATRIPETRLVAIADPDAAAREAVAAEHEVAAFASADELIGAPEVEAVVIVGPTSTHREHVIAAARRRLPIFCEKPPALSLAETREMKEAVERAGVFFQMGFMRRFDAGYAAAKSRVAAGEIGTPVLFKSSSRDPHRTTLEYANPKTSGGMILDMGIHDFDLARFFMGEVRAVQTVAGTLAYPELETVGDIDNAVVTLEFADGRLGVVDLSRNGIYGYDIATELLGTAGTLRIGYLRETPLFVMTKNSVAHDTVPYFMERFAGAYTAQLRNFALNVLEGRQAPVTIDDGIEALRIGLAAQRAHATGARVEVASVRE